MSPPSPSFAHEAKLSNPILEDSLPSVLWQMSWPLLISSVLTSIIGVSDLCIAGRINSESQVAVGIGEQVISLTVMIGAAISAGTGACVSRCMGAGHKALTQAFIKDSLLVTTILGSFATAIGLFLPEQIFSWLGSKHEISTIGIHYLQLCCLANLPFLLIMCLCSIYRSIGKPLYALYVWLLVTTISIACPWLGFYLGERCLDYIPWSWTSGTVLGLVFGFWLLHQAGSVCNLQVFACKSNPSARLERLKELLQIGIPTVIADVSSSISHIVMYRFLVDLPQASSLQAAWSVGIKLEEVFAAMPLLAVSLGAGAIVGQNLGAGRIDRARQAGIQMANWGAALMLLVGICLSVSGSYIAGIFSNDAHTCGLISSFLNASPLMLPLLAYPVILLGAMEGAGATSQAMRINLLGSLLLRIPLAWLLTVSCGWGLVGTWLGLCLSRLGVCLSAQKSFHCSNWYLTDISKSLTVQ